MVLTKLLTHHAFKVQNEPTQMAKQKKHGEYRDDWESLSHSEVTLSPPWSTWAWTHQSAWQKTSGLVYKFHQISFWMIHIAACGPATGDRTGQDAPVLPTRGRWSRLRHVWASNQWNRFWDYRLLKKWYRIFCRFLSLRSHYHDSVTCQSLCFCNP